MAVTALFFVGAIFEVAVAARDLHNLLERCLRERCAPEVGVQDHTGRVEDAGERRPAFLQDNGA